MISFILNNQLIETVLAPGSTVLDFVRYHKNLKGTKIGCREGDCGACTILVGDFENDKLVYRSMTSCLMPLGNAHGKHIVTVEGINLPPAKNSLPELSPVQKAMVDTNGTQCGFCTIGFIMSFTGFTFHHSKNYEDAIAAIDGNICRCTGYKSIERAAKLIIEKIKGKPAKDTITWLTDNGFLPVYFNDIEQRLKNLKTTIAEPNKEKNKLNLGVLSGGTDLIVQKPLSIKKSENELVFDRQDLKGIFEKNGIIHLGASVTVTHFAESPVIQKIFPGLKEHIKYISSTAIRNMATIAGNFVNASPIGDMTIYFLALDASIVLNKNGQQQRTIKLKDFYKGYKTLDKEEDEIIETILFSIPAKNTFFNFEKVSKRKYLDIATVNSAVTITLEKDVITDIHLSAGGVAAFPKYLNNTCNFLKGKTIQDSTLKEAIEVFNSEITPISDARGSADYKRLLLRQLFLAHFVKASGPELVQKILVP